MINNSITAIIPSFRRHENIPIIIERLKNQTRLPSRIIIWNDVAGSHPKFLELNDDSIEVINTNSNWWSNYGSYLIGYLTNTEYIAILDDDMPPGPKWFEFCIRKQKEQKGLYSKYGVIFTNKLKYNPNIHFSSEVGNDELKQVDMVGNSYFVPFDAINAMLFERPPTFRNTCDLHLSYMAKKYCGYNCYVPFPKNDEELPYYKPNELLVSKDERAMWADSNHYVDRNGYVRWAMRDGWNTINFTNEK